MNNDLLKLLQDTKDSMINGFSKISDSPTYENVLCGVEISFDKILKIVRFYDDVINSKWIKFSDACPEDFNLDWVLDNLLKNQGLLDYRTLLNLIKPKTFGDCKVKKMIIPLKPITLTMIAFHHRGK